MLYHIISCYIILYYIVLFYITYISHIFNQREYSLTACLKTCYQRETVSQCGCYQSSIPYTPESSEFSHTSNITVCDDSSPDVGRSQVPHYSVFIFK